MLLSGVLRFNNEKKYQEDYHPPVLTGNPSLLKLMNYQTSAVSNINWLTRSIAQVNAGDAETGWVLSSSEIARKTGTSFDSGCRP
jgi:hypothetical protein